MSNYDTLLLAHLRREPSASGWTGGLQLMETVVSTQEEAKRLAEDGAPEGTAVIAEEQTGGRGRMGRKWHSPRGKGIWMSVILRPKLPLLSTPQLTLLAGVAVCRAIRRVAGVEAGIKWPNDLLVSGRKVCGILLESSLNEGQLQYCIAGIGIDANLAEDDYPDFLKGIGTSLMIERGGASINRAELAGTVLSELELLYSLYLEQGFRPIGMLWESLSVTLGRQVALNTAQGRSEGKAVGLDSDGGLLLENHHGQLFSVCSGEIEMI
ncbi:biotin--[acetyl-CoA-carboxylase] ligase [Paenibacillus wynnii]|uniref:biotin--[acetyl-CoA-carboxylase] ligase n=1 Tax=Paenibacillus wynnii TaxID=268407 RepID=UPI00278D15ED|nr:biotin--[acetyl-CoA-carboxylase] ligase [Paenibacillus wynnii]MDQ0192953.1 BirA family biotin operon repressor/biotin-[acetyl-CoA-carboxylase] ligase [Paenibacillus wynnii]